MKIGSFQEFVRHDAIVEDLSPSLFSRKQVQKIALLDLRLLNSDRNGGNILVRKRSAGNTPKGGGGAHYDYELIPIDHGYCLPETICIDDPLNLCWYEWRQVKEPMDHDVVKYINSLDAEKDADILRQHLGLKEAALDNLRITTLLLKLGAAAKLSLYDIAQIVVREVSDTPSELERLKSAAEELAMAVWRSNHGRHPKPTAAGGRSSGRLPPLMVSMPVESVKPSLSPGSDGTTETDKEPQISTNSSSSSLEDIDNDGGESKQDTITTTATGPTIAPSTTTKPTSTAGHKKKVSMSVPLKINLDVIEREQEALSRAVTFKDPEVRPCSPPSPAGFWNEPLERMNARAQEQRVVCSGNGLMAGEALKLLSSSTATSDGGALVRQNSVYGSGGVRMAPIPSPYTFHSEDIGLSLSDEEFDYGGGGSSSDHQEQKPSKGCTEVVEEEDEDNGGDQFSWSYCDRDDSSVNHTSSAASGSSLSSTSSSPTPDLDDTSPVSSPTSDLGLPPRVTLPSRAVSVGGQEHHRELFSHHHHHKSRGSMMMNNGRRITRALSSPDFNKKGYLLQAYEGDDIERSKSTFWSGRVHNRTKFVKQSKEYRLYVLHYIHLLLKDLVERKAKQKSQDVISVM